MSAVYEVGILEDWVQTCLADRVYPIKIEISIDKDGNHTIEQHVDGRKLRGKFIVWMTTEFQARSKIKAPKNRNSKSFNKMWVMPMEELLRQALWVGGVDYDSLKPKDRYTTIHAICFREVLTHVIEVQREKGLTISSPASLTKVGTDITSQGNHYRTAIRKSEMALQQVTA